MITALLYLQYQSTRNRLVARFKRLKQPKYLVTLIVGVLYFYFVFHVNRRPGARGGAATTETLALLESVAALVLLVIVLLIWLIPNKRAALIFTSGALLDQRLGPATPRVSLTGRAALQRLRENHVVINFGYAPMLMLDPPGVAGFLGIPATPESAGPSQ